MQRSGTNPPALLLLVIVVDSAPPLLTFAPAGFPLVVTPALPPEPVAADCWLAFPPVAVVTLLPPAPLVFEVGRSPLLLQPVARKVPRTTWKAWGVFIVEPRRLRTEEWTTRIQRS